MNLVETVTLGAIQCEELNGDLASNLEKVGGVVEQAVRKNAQVILISELFEGLTFAEKKNLVFSHKHVP